MAITAAKKSRRRASPERVLVARDVVLDGRLALFHRRARWLVVADLHFGYELSQRAAGHLFPLWGMQTIAERVSELLDDYQPKHLVLLGDLVHNRAGGAELTSLIEELRRKCEVVLIAGNHDRYLAKSDLVESWRAGRFNFHHGHCEMEGNAPVQIIGHHHPAFTFRDGAGLRLRLPAFVQTPKCWIMPAFSPWAAGAEWPNEEGENRIWACSPQRVMKLG